jgi:GAF domain-containing protein
LKTEVIGVMEAINKQNATAFSPADVELAEALASLASVAIDNARMYAKLADAVVMARLSYRL